MLRRPGELRPNSAMMAAKRLAPPSIGLLAALFVFGAVPAAHSSVVPAADAGLKVQDRSHDNGNPEANLYAHYQIFNNGTATVPLSSLTMRYWFTDDNPSDKMVFGCDYAALNCTNVTARFVMLPSPVTKANEYVEIGFTAGAGSLAPGQSTGEIQTRIWHTTFAPINTDEVYSFITDPSFIYKDTQTVTLYENGTLIWGTEPT